MRQAIESIASTNLLAPLVGIPGSTVGQHHPNTGPATLVGLIIPLYLPNVTSQKIKHSACLVKNYIYLDT
jgi:hypothetical protein